MASTSLFILAYSTLYLLTQNAAFSSQITCNSNASSFSISTFENCNDLSTLNATLHWTYHPSNSSLSMAFTAPPPSPSGWAAIALNPKAQSMIGAQTLIAFKPTSSDPIAINTYNIQAYWTLSKGPISYNVTGLSAKESNEVITIWATWALRHGERSVNLVWQIGPVVDGRPANHELEPPNLKSMMKLSLTEGRTSGGSGVVGEPVARGPVQTIGENRAVEGCRVMILTVLLFGGLFVLLL